jgi:hypothetical protein
VKRKRTRTVFTCSDGIGEWFYELRYGLTHKYPTDTSRWSRARYTLRMALCGAGLHWPIKWSQGYYSGGYEPPEPTWECAWCGFERLPYRAVFWEGPFVHVAWAWAWLRSPRQMWRVHQEWKAYDRRAAEKAAP